MGGAKSGTWGTKVCPKGHRSFVAKQGNEFPGKDQASGLFFLARKKKKKKKLLFAMWLVTQNTPGIQLEA